MMFPADSGLKQGQTCAFSALYRLRYRLELAGMLAGMKFFLWFRYRLVLADKTLAGVLRDRGLILPVSATYRLSELFTD